MAETPASSYEPGEYRKYLPDLSSPRFAALKKSTAYDHVGAFHERQNPPWLHALYLHWRRLFKEPYRGVTSDGVVRPGLFTLQDEGVPVADIAKAAEAVCSRLTPAQQDAISYHIDSPEWRSWSNPEFYFSQKGIRLDEVGPDVQQAVLRVLEATLSPEGYRKAVAAMRINHFLGELCACPAVMNEFSYNFVLFGTPSAAAPWGYSFYGHHLCLNIFLYRNQLVLSPWFTGAEPNEIDEGPHAGTRILHEEEALALQLMRGLPPPLQQRVQLYKHMKDPTFPPGRWNKDDQRHLCGAYRDNRTIPYEGAQVSTLPPQQQALVWEILSQYLLYLPARSRAMQLERARSFAAETYFCWIGGFGAADPFYFRIQSPVVVVEFDHHSGVFLANGEPAKFHVHTLLRTPNAGDYGYALRALVPSAEEAFVWEEEGAGAGASQTQSQPQSQSKF